MTNDLFVIMNILFVFKGYFYGFSTAAVNDYTEKNTGTMEFSVSGSVLYISLFPPSLVYTYKPTYRLSRVYWIVQSRIANEVSCFVSVYIL